MAIAFVRSLQRASSFLLRTSYPLRISSRLLPQSQELSCSTTSTFLIPNISRQICRRNFSHGTVSLVISEGKPKFETREFIYGQWWSWSNILGSILDLTEEKNRRSGSGSSKCEDSYNIYDRNRDFSNDYGWSKALDFNVYLVNLTAGSMMAPHMNPTATEYGIVLAGSGDIQVVFPNGTSAMNTRVSVGDVFLIPRYFAFCQIASRTGPFEFVGFTTSAHKNRPQFLVGSNSLLRSLNVTSLAMAFGVDEETTRRFIEAQREAVILPTAAAAPPA